MCAKFPYRDLNLNPYPSHLTNIYICGVTIAYLFYTTNNMIFRLDSTILRIKIPSQILKLSKIPLSFS